MVEVTSHVKQLSPILMCKIGLSFYFTCSNPVDVQRPVLWNGLNQQRNPRVLSVVRVVVDTCDVGSKGTGYLPHEQKY